MPVLIEIQSKIQSISFNCIIFIVIRKLSSIFLSSEFFI